MTREYKSPIKIDLLNTRNKTEYFQPYRENTNFPIEPNGKVSFEVNDFGKAMYYLNQNGKIEVKEGSEGDTTITVGKYNASTGTFSTDASFNINAPVVQSDWETYKVYGTLPYSAETPEIGMPAGNRFTIKLKNKDIESKSDLPSGQICTIEVSNGTTNSYTKSAFEEDGSLIVVVNVKNNTTLTLNLKWTAGDDFTNNYQFTFENVKLAAEGEVVEDVENIVITTPQLISIQNISKKAVNIVPYKENFNWTIESETSIFFTCQTIEEVLYYALQSNENISVKIN